jgi:hypothetical protein
VAILTRGQICNAYVLMLLIVEHELYGFTVGCVLCCGPKVWETLDLNIESWAAQLDEGCEDSSCVFDGRSQVLRYRTVRCIRISAVVIFEAADVELTTRWSIRLCWYDFGISLGLGKPGSIDAYLLYTTCGWGLCSCSFGPLASPHPFAVQSETMPIQSWNHAQTVSKPCPPLVSLIRQIVRQMKALSGVPYAYVQRVRIRIQHTLVGLECCWVERLRSSWILKVKPF